MSVRRCGPAASTPPQAAWPPAGRLWPPVLAGFPRGFLGNGTGPSPVKPDDGHGAQPVPAGRHPVSVLVQTNPDQGR